MQKYLVFAFLSLILYPVQSQDILTLQDAISIGMANNFDIGIAQNTRRIAANDFTRGNAGFLPNVTWSGGRNYSTQNVNQEFINGSSNARNNAKSNTWSTAIDVNWTLFDGLRMFRTYDKLHAINVLAGLDEEIAMENTVFDIAVAFYNIILEQSQLRALDTTLQLSSDRVALSKTRYEVGKSPKLEYLSAQVDYNADYSALIAQRERLEQAKHDLNNLLARPINTPFNVSDDIALDSTLNLDALKQEALERNRPLTRARRTNAVLDLEMRELKADQLPRVDLNVGYNYNKLTSEAGFLLSNRTNGLNYGLTASWNIFNGNDLRRRMANNRILAENQELQVAQLRLLIERDLQNVYLIYSNSLQLVKLEQENLQVANESVDIALDRYKLGKATFLELREAQVNAVQTSSRLFDAIHSTKIAELQLLLLSGTLFDRNE